MERTEKKGTRNLWQHTWEHISQEVGDAVGTSPGHNAEARAGGPGHAGGGWRQIWALLLRWTNWQGTGSYTEEKGEAQYQGRELQLEQKGKPRGLGKE